MANPKKIPTGRKLQRFPGGTFNALVEDYHRRQGESPRPEIKLPTEARSCVITRLAWDGDEPLPAGHVVKLDEPLYKPDTNESAPFSGLAFECVTPTEGDEAEHLAITISPFPASTGNAMPTGFGFTPNSAWAKVDVTDPDHTYATVGSNSTLLVSATSGRFKIIWKESGLGEKWAVIELIQRGARLRWGIVNGTLGPAISQVASDWGVGAVIFYDDDGVSDAGTTEVANPFPAQFNDGYTVCCDVSKSPPRVVSGSCNGF